VFIANVKKRATASFGREANTTIGIQVRYERTADLAVNLASVIISGLSAIHRNMVCPDFH